MTIATVRYHVATYSGDISVSCDENDDNETICAMARAQLRRRVGELPFGYQSFRVTDRQEIK
jgi:hypothetical protein